MNRLASRRTLRRIETRAAGSDPRLAGLFSMFTWLTRDERMPGRERLRGRPVRLPAAAARDGWPVTAG
jgi:hypothetical protein